MWSCESWRRTSSKAVGVACSAVQVEASASRLTNFCSTAADREEGFFGHEGPINLRTDFLLVPSEKKFVTTQTMAGFSFTRAPGHGQNGLEHAYSRNRLTLGGCGFAQFLEGNFKLNFSSAFVLVCTVRDVFRSKVIIG